MAPLTNMMSMSVSIYWNTGQTNAWIFHESQGRMDRPFWQDVDTYIKNSPVFQIDKLKTPLLVTFGDEDGAVDWNQGVELYNAARLAGKPVVMLVYPGENHGLAKKPNQVDYHYRILEWFGHYLKGEKGRSGWPRASRTSTGRRSSTPSRRNTAARRSSATSKRARPAPIAAVGCCVCTSIGTQFLPVPGRCPPSGHRLRSDSCELRASPAFANQRVYVLSPSFQEQTPAGLAGVNKTLGRAMSMIPMPASGIPPNPEERRRSRRPADNRA